MSTMLREMMEKDEGREAAEILFALVTQAKRGNIAHIKEVLDRTEGKVPDKLEVAEPKRELQWTDDAEPDETPADLDAAPAQGSVGSEEVQGEIQGAGLRQEMGQDEARGGPVP